MPPPTSAHALEAALHARLAALAATAVAVSVDAASENADVLTKLFPTMDEVEASFRALSADNADKPLEERVELLARVFGEEQVGRTAAVGAEGATLEHRVCQSGLVAAWVRSVLLAEQAEAEARAETEARCESGSDPEPDERLPMPKPPARVEPPPAAKLRVVVVAGVVYAYLPHDRGAVYVLPNSVVEERVKDPAMVFEHQAEELVAELAQATRYDGAPMYGDGGPAARGRPGGWAGEGKLLGADFLRTSTELLPALLPRVDFNGKLSAPMRLQLAVSRALPDEVLVSGDTALSDACELQTAVFPLLPMSAHTAAVFQLPAVKGPRGHELRRTIHLVPFARGPAKNETWHCPLAGGAVLLNLFPPCAFNQSSFAAAVQDAMRDQQVVDVDAAGLGARQVPAADALQAVRDTFARERAELHAAVQAAVDPVVVLGTRAIGSPHWPVDTTLTLDCVRASALVALKGVTPRGLKTIFMAAYDGAEAKFTQAPDTHLSHSDYNVTVDTHVAFCWQPRVAQLRAALAAAALEPVAEAEAEAAAPQLPPMVQHLDDRDLSEAQSARCKELSALNVATRNCVTSERRELHQHIANCAEDLCMLVMGAHGSRAWRGAVAECTPLQRAWVTTKHVVEAILRLACQEDAGVEGCTEQSVEEYLRGLQDLAAQGAAAERAPPRPAAAEDVQQYPQAYVDAALDPAHGAVAADLRQPTQAAPANDAAQREQGTPSSAPGPSLAFAPCPAFEGAREGWEFKTGPLGTGYYRRLQ
jgi:hypothetical protein